MQVVFRIAFTVAVVFLTTVHGSSAELDEHYLRAFAVKSSNSLDKALIAPEANGSNTVRCGTGIKHQLRRDWSKLESSTQKVLAGVLGKPTLSGPESTITSSGGHFKVHYTTTGTDAPNLALINQYTNLGVASTTAWVNIVGEVFETAYQFYTGRGYRMPANVPYDVYLNTPLDDRGRLVYGLTTDLSPTPSGQYNYAYSSFIEINKDFAAGPFLNYTPLQSLQITAAHEFHHAVQFSYNDFFPFWYAEMTATWMEDEVWDSVNQLYDYLTDYLPVGSRLSLNAPDDGASEYGRWIFNRFLVEDHHTSDVVRTFWEELGTKAPVNSNTDIDMTPLIDSVLSSSYNSSLGADFLGFAKKIYTRGWTSHTNEIAKIPTYTVTASYSSYPVNVSSLLRPSATLPRYTFAFYRFVPSPVITTFNVMITKTTGIQTALFKKVNGVVSEITPDTGGNAYSVIGFNALNPATDEVVLLVANTTDVDNHQANFSTDGSTLATTEPSVAAAAGSGGGSSGGCFIATAAYGSYLHPKVAELRLFRDRHLLTNAPGRLFVSLYYRLSPPIAEVIAEHEWMKGGVRGLLVPVVLSVEHPAGALGVVLLLMGGTVGLVKRRKLRLVRVRR